MGGDAVDTRKVLMLMPMSAAESKQRNQGAKAALTAIQQKLRLSARPGGDGGGND